MSYQHSTCDRCGNNIAYRPNIAAAEAAPRFCRRCTERELLASLLPAQAPSDGEGVEVRIEIPQNMLGAMAPPSVFRVGVELALVGIPSPSSRHASPSTIQKLFANEEILAKIISFCLCPIDRVVEKAIDVRATAAQNHQTVINDLLAEFQQLRRYFAVNKIYFLNLIRDITIQQYIQDFFETLSPVGQISWDVPHRLPQLNFQQVSQVSFQIKRGIPLLKKIYNLILVGPHSLAIRPEERYQFANCIALVFLITFIILGTLIIGIGFASVGKEVIDTPFDPDIPLPPRVNSTIRGASNVTAWDCFTSLSSLESYDSNRCVLSFNGLGMLGLGLLIALFHKITSWCNQSRSNKLEHMIDQSFPLPLAQQIRIIMDENQPILRQLLAMVDNSGLLMPRILNIDKVIQHIEQHTGGINPQKKCATHIHEALVAGGLDLRRRPQYAKDYGPLLLRHGFVHVSHLGFSEPAPQKGDIRVVQGDEIRGIEGDIRIYALQRGWLPAWPPFRNQDIPFNTYRYELLIPPMVP
jgi:hypothetical protein